MACELAVAGKKLVAAKRAVEAWRKLVDPALPEIQEAWKEVTVGLRQAEELAARARKLERIDPPAARSLYRKSLEIAADLPDALAGLNRCPPDAPTGAGRPGAGRSRSGSPGLRPRPDGLGPLTFAIVRKRGGLPQHPGDGTRIAEVSTCEFDDRHVKPGETVSYAVLAKRATSSRWPPSRRGPVDLPARRPRMSGSSRARARSSCRGFLLTACSRSGWSASFGSPPTGPRDGDRICGALDQALDHGLGRDQVYHYGIYAIYRDARTAGAIASPGFVVAAIPRLAAAPP